MVTILFGIAIFLFGVSCGYIVLGILMGAKYVGVIHVHETEDKIVYSLELMHDPEELRNMKDALFKVASTDGDLDRGENNAYNETPN